MIKIFFLCCFILCVQFAFVNSKSLVDPRNLYGKGVPVQKPYIPLIQEEFTKNYKNFATKLVKDFNIVDDDEGITFGTFNLGHALAVLHEHVILNVSTKGFSEVLETPDLQITNSYRDLLRILAKDSKVSITSTIYTQQDFVQLTVGIGKLKSWVNLVDPKKSPAEYVDFINSDISNKSQFGILVPAFPNIPGIPDGDYYATTFNYKNSWENKWAKSEGNRTFTSSKGIMDSVEFMETTGRFAYISNEEFEFVKVPLQGSQKILLLAKSKKSVDQLDTKTMWKQFTSKVFDLKSSQWSTKLIKLVVPSFEYLSGISYFEQLKKLGITEAMCLSTSGTGANSLDQIAQVSKIRIAPKDLSLTIITETKDNISLKNKLKSRKRRFIDLNDEAEVELNFSKLQRERRESENVSNANAPVETIITLDQPYFWTLEDGEIGPLALGAIVLPIDSLSKRSANFMENYLDCGKAKSV